MLESERLLNTHLEQDYVLCVEYSKDINSMLYLNMDNLTSLLYLYVKHDEQDTFS